MTDLLQLAREVGDIAREAGAEILKIYDQEDFGVETKDDDSPLTRADQASNDVINRKLRELTFQAPIISEENKEVPYSERSQYTRFWMVDPLDGTKEFIKRNGEFTVNIALVDTNKPIIGVVYIPVKDELYYAVAGKGAYQLVDGTPQRLEASTFKASDAGLKIVASRSHLNDATKAYMEQFQEPEIVSAGSSLKLLLLAQGAAHVYPRLAPTMEWDICAAQIVLEEAGGKVINRETNLPLAYNKESLRNPEFVAYGQLMF